MFSHLIAMINLCCCLVLGLLADPCVSGTPVGKRPGPYSFLVATGAERGKQTCYICEQETKPTVVVFSRTLSAPLGKLLAAFDAEVPKHQDAGFKVWMTQLVARADLDGLAKWSQSQGLKSIPVGAFEDVDGPPAYKLHADADVTVLLFVNEKVVANFAFRKDELTEDAVRKVMKRLPELFSK
ncbi:MAG: hypothetical protein U0798_04840 [Gemmataceae bacterium]